MNWQGFISNRWPGSACFEPLFLNTSQGIFFKVPKPCKLCPCVGTLTSAEVERDDTSCACPVGQVFCLQAVNLGCVPTPEKFFPKRHPPVLTQWLPTPWACWVLLPTCLPFPVPLGFFLKDNRVEGKTACTCISLHGAAESELKFVPTSLQCLAHLPLSYSN